MCSKNVTLAQFFLTFIQFLNFCSKNEQIATNYSETLKLHTSIYNTGRSKTWVRPRHLVDSKFREKKRFFNIAYNGDPERPFSNNQIKIENFPQQTSKITKLRQADTI